MKKKNLSSLKEIFLLKLPMKTLPNHVPFPCDGAIFLKLIKSCIITVCLFEKKPGFD